MRTLDCQEVAIVSGGVIPAAVVGVIKVGGAVLSGLATVAGTVYATKKAIETAEDLCKSGSETTIRMPQVQISCTAVQKPTPPASSPQQRIIGEDDLLKARLPNGATGF